MADITVLRDQINRYITDTDESRRLSERDRDYYDHKQWTDNQVSKLRSRQQAAIVVNRIKPKVEGLIGLYNMRQTDPKAFPRTEKHEEASHVITDALRFVADNNELDMTKADVAEDFFIEGTAGAITDVKQNASGEIEIRITRIPWDRIYFDTHSREKDFSDARYMGQMVWLSEDQVKELFPKTSKTVLENLLAGGQELEGDGETFEDRPRWQDRDRRRIRVAFHFYINKGKWWYAIFSGDEFLVKPKESPFLDDEGEPSNIIELVSANVDRDNRRYGEVRAYIDLQDEINHRRSKSLHLLSVRQTFGRQGKEKDIDAMKRELNKPNGHVQFTGEKFGQDFGVLPTADMTQGQFEFYQDSKNELDAISFNAQLAGERGSGELSGRAIDKLQRAGTIELNRQFAVLNAWEKRIYKQIWARIKQFWNEEKWIRVTDDQDNLRWVGLNSQVTTQQWLEEQINDESLLLEDRQKFAASFQFLMSAAQNPDTSQQANAKLNEIIEVRNETSGLDIDIILDQSFDVINAQEEQFNAILQFAQGGDIDIVDLIALAPDVRNKDELIEKIEKRRAAAAQAAGNVAQLEAQDQQANTAKTMSEVQLNTQDAITKQIENTILVNNPDPTPQVNT